jgi:type I restriction enzyme S subunit
MDTAQYNIPSLRFPKFEGEWQERRLGDICKNFKSGIGITAKDIYPIGKYPVFGGNGLRGYTDTFTHDGFYVLIGRQGALCGNITRSYGKAYITEHAIAVDGNDATDNEWLAQILDLLNLNRLSESSAQPGLSVNKIVKLKLNVPILSEQKKIASFLAAVDKKVQQLKRKKELLEQYKKGVMQQLFSQQLCFKDDNGNDYPDWLEKTISDVAKLKYGKEQKQIASEDGIYPIMGTGGEIGRTNKFLYDKPSVLIGRKGTIDRPFYITTPFWTVDTLFYTEINEFVDEKWLFYLFQTINWLRYNEASGVPSLSAGTINKIKLRIPVLGEQKKIADFLSSIDQKISFVETEIEQTQKFKIGLLQQMFV